jgi:hypothetical protein
VQAGSRSNGLNDSFLPALDWEELHRSSVWSATPKRRVESIGGAWHHASPRASPHADRVVSQGFTRLAAWLRSSAAAVSAAAFASK